MSRSTYVMTMIESLCASLTSVRARDRQPGTMGDRVLSRSTYVPDPRVSTTCRWGGGYTADFGRSGVIRGLQRPLGCSLKEQNFVPEGTGRPFPSGFPGAGCGLAGSMKLSKASDLLQVALTAASGYHPAR